MLYLKLHLHYRNKWSKFLIVFVFLLKNITGLWFDLLSISWLLSWRTKTHKNKGNISQTKYNWKYYMRSENKKLIISLNFSPNESERPIKRFHGRKRSFSWKSWRRQHDFLRRFVLLMNKCKCFSDEISWNWSDITTEKNSVKIFLNLF